LYAQGNLPEAAEAYRRLIALEPDWIDFHIHLGIILYEQGKAADAVQACQNALALGGKLDPTEASYWDIRAASLLKHIGRAHESEAVYRRALAEWNKLLDLTRGEAAFRLNDLAWYLATDVGPEPRTRDPGWAVELARKAVIWAPDDAPQSELFWRTLGVALYRVGDCQAAIAALDKSTALGRPKVAYNSLLLALGHWRLREKARPRRWYYDLADQWVHKWGKGNLAGWMSLAPENWKAVIPSLDNWVARDRANLACNSFFLAMAHWRLGDQEQARRWYDRALQWMGTDKLENEELSQFRAEAARLLAHTKKEDAPK
jgi:tetratricopeptide (TPR) repeat protein